MEEVKKCMNTQKEQHEKKTDELEKHFLSEKNEFEKEIQRLRSLNESLEQ